MICRIQKYGDDAGHGKGQRKSSFGIESLKWEYFDKSTLSIVAGNTHVSDSPTDWLTNKLVENWMSWPKYADYADYHADYADYADSADYADQPNIANQTY